jgi:hypothetical protein
LSYETAVVIGLLGLTFLFFYVSNSLKDEKEMMPLRIFFFVIGLVFVLIVPSSMTTITDLNNNNGTWTPEIYGNMTARMGTAFETNTWTMRVGITYVCIYFIYWLLMLFGDIATKKGKEWKSDRGGGRFG